MDLLQFPTIVFPYKKFVIQEWLIIKSGLRFFHWVSEQPIQYHSNTTVFFLKSMHCI